MGIVLLVSGNGNGDTINSDNNGPINDVPNNNGPFNNGPDNDIPSKAEIIECLADAGVLIYGTLTCPACNALVESYGGYDVIDPIYVICNQDWDRCNEEMQTDYVPEIQIQGELYKGSRSLEDLAEAVKCVFNSNN